MEIVVLWSDAAIEELRAIYDYLFFKAGKQIADKISNTIVDKTLSWSNHPVLDRKRKCWRFQTRK